jgi:hypothetical protein
MINMAFGIAVADFFSMLSLGFLVLIADPVSPPVSHEILTRTRNTILLRTSGNEYNVWSGNDWSGHIDFQELRQRLVITCDNQDYCLDLFSATSEPVDQILIALPRINKEKVKDIFFKKCASAPCKDIIFLHDGQSVTLKTIAQSTTTPRGDHHGL